MFTYHSPRPDQLPRYEAIRSSAKALAYVISANTEVSPDQTRAINSIREAVMFANASIALEPSLNQAAMGFAEMPAETRGLERDIRGGRPYRE
jgi:hypothetical protein